MNRVGIIGFGQFGQFMASHLSKYVEVLAFDSAGGNSPFLAPLEKVCETECVIFAVPVQSLDAACEEAKQHISESTLIADVSSVKVKALDILKRHFPNNQILGTHPIFGPQSGKNGIEGLPIVLSNISWSPDRYAAITTFLSNTLGLRVIERTPEQADIEMAKVQGLAHFIGRALNSLDIQEYETSTKSYQQLLELRNLLRDDSWELFKTIQNGNAYAAEVRKEFLEALTSLEAGLEGDSLTG